MYVGNVMLLVLNLPLIGIWVRLLKVLILYPLIAAFLLDAGLYLEQQCGRNIYHGDFRYCGSVASPGRIRGSTFSAGARCRTWKAPSGSRWKLAGKFRIFFSRRFRCVDGTDFGFSINLPHPRIEEKEAKARCRRKYAANLDQRRGPTILVIAKS